MAIRKTGVCLALLVGSYLASGLINASPVTQQALSGPRPRVVIVAPAESPGFPLETPAPMPGDEVARPAAVHSL